ncbi:SET domain-containing protein SmydA-8 isoform X2 [Frankliniella occidentalis]|uniref:SET domain-containing protein SmydA-8 isoform X2 n=1 Tax=Frankliniella occidentalis TaxID=133901 RepID=A0A6J1SXY1_FRAOC|nr:SET domain-containing protein SmydA-8 isoform X2 [Frankliniella occidentalis]
MGGKKYKSKSNKKNHKRQQQQASQQLNNNNINHNNNNNHDPDDPDWEDSPGKPYKVKISPTMGRYLVATKDIAAGELIVREEALVVGPCQNAKPVCLGCLKQFDGEHYIRSSDNEDCDRCMGCQWPLCCPTCPGLERDDKAGGQAVRLGHTDEECAALSAAGPSGRRVVDLRARTPLYNVIVPLRILLLEKQDPARWKAIHKMQSQDDVRRQIPGVWQANQLGVVDRIRNEFGLQQYPEDVIHTLCGILEVNAFEVGDGLRALYGVAFLLAHDCTPNTSHSDDELRALSLRASVPIPKGHAITLSYAYTIQGTLKRREHLKESKFFDCCCSRCSDPTELGSMCSALVCPRCGRPSVLPTDPLQADAPWRCVPPRLEPRPGAKQEQPCPGYEMTAKEVKEFLDKLTDESEALDHNDVVGLEGFLVKHAARLHPNHFLLLGAKHSLSQVYGKVQGYLIHQLPDALLERKLTICRDILSIFDLLEPGVSRLRGITLYEMHAPIMILTTRQFEANAISRKDLRTRLREVASCLEQAAHILCLEPESSSEGAVGRAAQDALQRVRQWQ